MNESNVATMDVDRVSGALRAEMEKHGLTVTKTEPISGVHLLTGVSPKAELPRLECRLITAPGYFKDSVVSPDPRYFSGEIGDVVEDIHVELGLQGFERIRTWQPLGEYRLVNTPL